MAINEMIIDKIIEKCGNDPKMRAFIMEILKLEADKITQFKDKYKDLIKHFVSEEQNNEN